MKKSDAKKLARRKRNLKRRAVGKAARRSSSYNLNYEISGRVNGTSHGGVPAMLELARGAGLFDMIDASVGVLLQHRPYKESDHIAAILAAILAGETCPEGLRRVRQDNEFLDSLGVERFPDSTTCGDYLDRYEEQDIHDLTGAFLTTSENLLLARLHPQERKLADINVDGTIAPTDAECMEGIDYCAYKKQWGYAPLLISLANTQQPLVIVNRPGNASSSKDAAAYLDISVASMLKIFERARLSGDTDFSQTRYLDAWHETGRIDFTFVFDACQALVERAQALGPEAWSRFKRPAPYEIKTKPHAKAERIKDKLIEEKGWRDLKTLHEDIAEFEYQPGACKRAYRMVVLRKHIQIKQGQLELEPTTRYFFYITNQKDVPAREIVRQANKRCNQENLIAQLKGAVSSLKTTGATLEANWAWMVIASMAWTLKSWFALMSENLQERKRLIGMEFRTFQNCFMTLPVQVVRTGRRTVLRILGGYLPGLRTFLNIWENIHGLCRIRV